jgi:DNA methylase
MSSSASSASARSRISTMSSSAASAVHGRMSGITPESTRSGPAASTTSSPIRPSSRALVADAMKDCTRRGDIVLDTFCGSGTTILAAERVGRRAYTLELEPRFVDVAIKRWQAFTRKDAIHVETGLTFGEVTSERTTQLAAA